MQKKVLFFFLSLKKITRQTGRFWLCLCLIREENRDHFVSLIDFSEVHLYKISRVNQRIGIDTLILGTLIWRVFEYLNEHHWNKLFRFSVDIISSAHHLFSVEGWTTKVFNVSRINLSSSYKIWWLYQIHAHEFHSKVINHLSHVISVQLSEAWLTMDTNHCYKVKFLGIFYFSMWWPVTRH